jgi:hypothetical protein
MHVLLLQQHLQGINQHLQQPQQPVESKQNKHLRGQQEITTTRHCFFKKLGSLVNAGGLLS